MAKYAADLSPRALEDIQARSSDVAARILRKLRELEDSPFPRGDTIKHLKGFETPTQPAREALGRSRGPAQHPDQRSVVEITDYH